VSQVPAASSSEDGGSRQLNLALYLRIREPLSSTFNVITNTSFVPSTQIIMIMIMLIMSPLLQSVPWGEWK
jgi:hypothetical protein